MNPRALTLICLLTPAIAAALPGLESEDTETTAASDAGETPTVPASNFADDRFYLAPFGTFIQPGGARNANAGWGGGLGFGKILNQFFNVEVRGFWQGFDSRGYPHYSQAFKGLSAAEGGYNLAGGAIDFQYYFSRDAFTPYTVFSLGAMNTQYPGELNAQPFAGDAGRSTVSFIFEAGAGLSWELADNLLFRGDVRYRGDTAPGQVKHSEVALANDLLVNMGFVVPLGDKPEAAAAPLASDDCAARDTDADGVNDCDDKCPGTAGSAKVDSQGCPTLLELRGVGFQYDSSRLTDRARATLDGVAEQLVAFPAGKEIEVAGYASDEGKRGRESHNLALSQHRSETVAQYLRDKGVSNPLFAKGYGTEYPVADNGTEAGRQQNRRVELRWQQD
ncbi:MAG: OmpA family protein [Methylococcus sp.]|nr:MAG: OmpA family protein [Methylococcus sp.]